MSTSQVSLSKEQTTSIITCVRSSAHLQDIALQLEQLIAGSEDFTLVITNVSAV